jgi:1-acyl-sn-glycerol-3-phosphate acyltransferase
MLRAYLLVYPFLVVYVTLATLIGVPITWIIRDIRLLYWLSRTGVRIALWLSGVRIEQIHPERATQYPTCVFVSNHVSNLDPAALFRTLPRITVVLKESLGKIPFLGYVMRLGGFIYVDRQNRNSRRNAVEASVAALRSGLSLLIFPEGTRSPDGNLLPFRPGPFSMAIEAKTPVVPITMHGTRELMPKGKASIKPGTIQLRFHTPIETRDMTADDRASLMQQVRRVMEEALRSGGSLHGINEKS